jgi:serine/threonine protein kinase/tetratricopeptide (TPR) repeat protein
MNSTREEDNSRRDQEKTTPLPNYEEKPSGEIGRYKILSTLGEGGHGIVYLAEQDSPVKRRVAVKVIKPGMDTKQVIARFEAERQAMAVLDHPNIAHVYDAGETSAGRPYFVMEYVKGVPITEHCDRRKLTIEDRLNIFLQVCEAVQHAHQKGIIHRDIKSSNIIVSIELSKAVPKVIDFGVAKALTQSLTAQTLVTEQGQILGTPEYMSPEQAEMTGQDIDTRSDIYSLGVVLYELLTGALPFDSKELREGGVEHIRHVICEEEPETPSVRLSRLSSEESAKLARHRQADAVTLERKLRGDLDWITLRAMEKDRTRRYASVGEFIADIKHYLNQEPVAAGPPSTVYRLKKFVRRNRALVISVGVVLVVLAAGIIVSLLLAIGQTRARRETQAVADFLTNDLLGLVVPEKARGPQVTVRYVLDAASENLEARFKGKPVVEASIRQTLGETYRKLGDYENAKLHLEKAYMIRREHFGLEHPSTLDSMSLLGWVYCLQTRYDDAEPLLAEAYENRRRVLGEEHPDTLESMARLGELYYYQRKLDQAETLLVKAYETARHILGYEQPVTLETMKGLARLYMAVRRDSEAEPLCVKGLEVSRRLLGEEHEVTLVFMSQLGGVYIGQGRYEETGSLLTDALENSQRVLGDDHPVTLDCMYYLGILYKAESRYDEAESLLVKSMEGNRRVLGENHIQVLSCMYRLAMLYEEQGRYEQAESLLIKALEGSRRSLGEEHMFVSTCMWELSKLYTIQGRYQEALKLFIQECQRLRRDRDPNDPAIALPLHGLAWLQATYPLDELRNGTEAINNATRACVLTNWEEGSYIDTLAAAYAEAGDFESAIKWQEKAIALVSKPWRHMLDVGMKARLELYQNHKPYHASPLRMDAELSSRLGRYNQAEREFLAALNVSSRLFGEQHEETLACTRGLIALYEAWNKQEEAEKWRAKLPQTEAKIE